MELKILVKSPEIFSDTFTIQKGPKAGEEMTTHKQNAALDAGGDFLLPFKLSVKAGKPYQPGEYTISPNSFSVGRFGDLEINSYAFQIVPVGQKLKAAS